VGSKLHHESSKDKSGLGLEWLWLSLVETERAFAAKLSLYHHRFYILGNKVLAFDSVKASKYEGLFFIQQVKSDLTFHVILGECLVVAGDESPIEDDAYLETDPDVHQAVEDNQAGEGKHIGCAVAPTGCVFCVVCPKYPEEAYNSPGQASE